MPVAQAAPVQQRRQPGDAVLDLAVRHGQAALANATPFGWRRKAVSTRSEKVAVSCNPANRSSLAGRRPERNKRAPTVTPFGVVNRSWTTATGHGACMKTATETEPRITAT